MHYWIELWFLSWVIKFFQSRRWKNTETFRMIRWFRSLYILIIKWLMKRGVFPNSKLLERQTTWPEVSFWTAWTRYPVARLVSFLWMSTSFVKAPDTTIVFSLHIYKTNKPGSFSKYFKPSTTITLCLVSSCKPKYFFDSSYIFFSISTTVILSWKGQIMKFFCTVLFHSNNTVKKWWYGYGSDAP